MNIGILLGHICAGPSSICIFKVIRCNKLLYKVAVAIHTNPALIHIITNIWDCQALNIFLSDEYKISCILVCISLITSKTEYSFVIFILYFYIPFLLLFLCPFSYWVVTGGRQHTLNKEKSKLPSMSDGHMCHGKAEAGERNEECSGRSSVFNRDSK